MRRRVAMFWEVLSAAWDLQWNDLPPTERARRAAAGMAGLTAAGMLLGLLVVVAGFAGRVSFFNELFAEELSEDLWAPLARTVLAFASGAGATAVIAVGVTILVANALLTAGH